jgi:flagellar protein FlaG
MSSDFSLPSLSKPVLYDSSSTGATTQRSGGVEVLKPVSNDSTANYDMSTTEDLKLAELQGRKVSLGEEELIKVIERANKALQGIMTTFEFRIHDATKQIMVKVLDKETGKVIREIPPEKVLDMVAKLWEKAGIIVDERR